MVLYLDHGSDSVVVDSDLWQLCGTSWEFVDTGSGFVLWLTVVCGGVNYGGLLVCSGM